LTLLNAPHHLVKQFYPKMYWNYPYRSKYRIHDKR